MTETDNPFDVKLNLLLTVVEKELAKIKLVQKNGLKHTLIEPCLKHTEMIVKQIRELVAQTMEGEE